MAYFQASFEFVKWICSKETGDQVACAGIMVFLYCTIFGPPLYVAFLFCRWLIRTAFYSDVAVERFPNNFGKW